MTTTSRETSHPARQSFRQGLPLAQFVGDRAELLPGLSPTTHLPVVGDSLRDSLAHWWLKNQLWISWSLLIVPLALELIYGTLPASLPHSRSVIHSRNLSDLSQRSISFASKDQRVRSAGSASSRNCGSFGYSDRRQRSNNALSRSARADLRSRNG